MYNALLEVRRPCFGDPKYSSPYVLQFPPILMKDELKLVIRQEIQCNVQKCLGQFWYRHVEIKYTRNILGPKGNFIFDAVDLTKYYKCYTNFTVSTVENPSPNSALARAGWKSSCTSEKNADIRKLPFPNSRIFLKALNTTNPLHSLGIFMVMHTTAL